MNRGIFRRAWDELRVQFGFWQGERHLLQELQSFLWENHFWGTDGQDDNYILKRKREFRDAFDDKYCEMLRKSRTKGGVSRLASYHLQVTLRSVEQELKDERTMAGIMERAFWGKPDPTQQPYGLPYWIVKNAEQQP